MLTSTVVSTGPVIVLSKCSAAQMVLGSELFLSDF